LINNEEYDLLLNTEFDKQNKTYSWYGFEMNIERWFNELIESLPASLCVANARPHPK